MTKHIGAALTKVGQVAFSRFVLLHLFSCSVISDAWVGHIMVSDYLMSMPWKQTYYYKCLCHTQDLQNAVRLQFSSQKTLEVIMIFGSMDVMSWNTFSYKPLVLAAENIHVQQVAPDSRGSGEDCYNLRNTAKAQSMELEVGRLGVNAASCAAELYWSWPPSNARWDTSPDNGFTCTCRRGHPHSHTALR